MNPLDWTAGPFLQLYVTLALTGFLFCLYLRNNIGEQAGEPKIERQLTPLELAYLAAGPQRVGDAFLIGLTMAKKATVSPDGKTIDVAADATLPQEPGVAVPASLSGPMTRGMFQSRLQPVLDSLKGRLQRMELVPNEEQLAKYRTQVLLFMGGPLILGVAKMIVGLERNKPVGFLIILSIVLVVAGIFLLTSPRLTLTGKAALQNEQSANARAARAPVENEFMLAVALAGLVVLSGTPL